MLQIIEKDFYVKLFKYSSILIVLVFIGLLVTTCLLVSVNYKTYNNIKIIKEVLSKQQPT